MKDLKKLKNLKPLTRIDQKSINGGTNDSCEKTCRYPGTISTCCAGYACYYVGNQSIGFCKVQNDL